VDPVEALNPLASERALMEMFNALDEHWEAHLLHARSISYRRLPCKCVVHVVPFGSRPSSPIFKMLYLIACIIKGVGVIRRYRHVYFTACKGGHLYLGLVAYVIARLTKRRCLLRVNEDTVLSLKLFLIKAGFPIFLANFLGYLARALEIHLLKHVDRVVTHGPMDYQRIKQLAKPNKASFIPLGINLNLFKRLSAEKVREFKNRLLSSEDVQVVLFVGRLDPVKDLPTLLKAFKLILAKRFNTVLLIVGRGPEEPKYKALAEELGIANRVFFLGFIPNERLPTYYNIADVYVLPSLYEEWSNTIMEAMACGVPVVATAVGANPWLIRNGETGFLVPVRKPDLLAEKIAILLHDQKLAKRMVRKARELIRRYDLRASGLAYRKVMLELVKHYDD